MCQPARARFGRDCRLVRGDAFREAFDQSDGRRTRTFVLWVRRAPDAARRLGVVASKRTFRHAVDRNRARRLLRESFRLHRHLLAEGVDLVLLARHRILDGKRAEVDRDLLVALRKEGLLLDGAPGGRALPDGGTSRPGEPTGADLQAARPTDNGKRETADQR